MICPCKDCEIRLVGCHAYCPEYKGWKDDQEKDKRHASERPEIPINMIRCIWKKMRWGARK